MLIDRTGPDVVKIAAVVLLLLLIGLIRWTGCFPDHHVKPATTSTSTTRQR